MSVGTGRQNQQENQQSSENNAFLCPYDHILVLVCQIEWSRKNKNLPCLACLINHIARVTLQVCFARMNSWELVQKPGTPVSALITSCTCISITVVAVVAVVRKNCCIFFWASQRCSSDSTVSEDAGIEPRTVATSALDVKRSNLSATVDLIHNLGQI